MTLFKKVRSRYRMTLREREYFQERGAFPPTWYYKWTHYAVEPTMRLLAWNYFRRTTWRQYDPD